MNVQELLTKVSRIFRKKSVYLPVLAFLSLLFGLGLWGLQKRKQILQSVIVRAQDKMQRDYGLILEIKEREFSGLFKVRLSGISLFQSGKPQLLHAAAFRLGLRPVPLLFGKLRFDQVQLQDAGLYFITKDSVKNYDFIKADTAVDGAGLPATDTEQESSRDLARLVYTLIEEVLYKIPENLELRNLEVVYQNEAEHQRLSIPEMNVVSGRLRADLLLSPNQARWHLQGILQPGRKRLSFKLYAEQGSVRIPVLEEKTGLQLSFDTLEAALLGVKWRNRHELELSGSMETRNLRFFHERIADTTIRIPYAFVDTEWRIGQNEVALQQGTELKLGEVTFLPSARLELGRHKTYTLGLEVPEQDAQAILEAFPGELFSTLQGMQVRGTLGYRLNFFLDDLKPDSLQLSSQISADGFSVERWGEEDFRKINSAFRYVPYENGVAQRSISVSLDNPNFVAYQSISPLLKDAVLTAEDPSFFSHRGFVPQAITASIATNYKAGAFKRGGSTISMQLVKNVFLNRDKNLARKVEEMMIVWLIENQHLVSKQRMFEVYLNVIEWGVNVYGAGEAARYYFDKHPSELSLGESIFLASIVPRPKAGLYRFNPDGHLREYMESYFNLIGGLMARRGLIEADSLDGYGFHQVMLKPSLRPSAPARDSIPIIPQQDLDLEIQEVGSMLENLFKPKSDHENPN